MYQIYYKKKAIKALEKMPVNMASKFQFAFKQIAQGHNETLDIKRLSGLDGYRLRIGDYRAIHEIDNGRLIITVITIGNRGDIYK